MSVYGYMIIAGKLSPSDMQCFIKPNFKGTTCATIKTCGHEK